jgi:hypothetical protein
MPSLAHTKAELLSKGVVLSPRFLDNYGPPFIEKRRAYGSSDAIEVRDALLPQELFLLPDQIVVAINVRQGSPWLLDYNNGYQLLGPDGSRFEITFPMRPRFYDWVLNNGEKLSRLVTLYGGSSLGLFIYGNCALVDIGKACQYCSIEPNHRYGTDFAKIIRPDLLKEAVSRALHDSDTPASQVMLNGGNFQQPDRSFIYYVNAVRAARDAINQSGRDVELHLIVFPPKDLELFKELAELDVSVAINMEVFDPSLFERYCPGKHATAGQEHIRKALARAAEILGAGRVYSIVVGGLEPFQSMTMGMDQLADIGVTPVINVFHADPETPLASRSSPSTHEIISMGRALQELYTRHKYMRPFYLDCGRNALDTEAFRGLF